MAEQPAEPLKRRRRSRRSQRNDGSWLAYWRSPAFGRHVFIGMVVIAVAYVGMTLWQTRRATIHYHGLNIGDTEAQVRYMMGEPDAADPATREYRYQEEGREIVTRLGPDGRLGMVRCTSEPGLPTSCPELRGIGIGDTEDRVVVRLGAPSRESYPGNDKVLHYDGMGLSFTLRRYRVLAIELNGGSGVSGYLPRALWAMIP